MPDEQPGCLGSLMRLFGIKRHQIVDEEPPAEVQYASNQMTSAPQVEQAAPSLELLQQRLPPTAEIVSFPYKVQRSLLMQSEMVFYRGLASVVGTRALICPKVR